MTDKPTLYLQNDLFWEDENLISNRRAAEKYFKCVALEDEWVMNPASRLFLTPMSFLRGSMDLARKARLTMKHANVMQWLPALRPHCINEDGFFTDLAHILKEMPGDLFVRPISPFKEFSGQVFSQKKLATEIAFMQQNKNIQPYELIAMASEPREIAKEWRLVFVAGEYVSGSQYMEKGELNVKPEVPQEVVNYGKSMATHSYFLNVFDFVLDVGETNGKLGIVEINGFETASFYAADLDAIYKAWSNFSV